MKLSAPVYRLKRQARLMARDEGLALHAALDRVAMAEGVPSWSLLVANRAAASPADKLFSRLDPGDLLLIGARPGHGKTILSLELTLQAIRSGHRSAFFSLDWTVGDARERVQAMTSEPTSLFRSLELHDCDAINADHIVKTLAQAPRGTLAVVDYLQLLDQKRDNPPLLAQIQHLRSFARDKGVILVFTSQIDRFYDETRKNCPDLDDVRLPNPLDLSLFDKTCFLNNGHVRFGRVH